MHYYQWKIGDYRRDTAHLSHLEHGIYRTLIDTYMLNEAPLTGDIQELERKHNIKTKNEKQALLSVLNDFFKFENETFLHCRCDENISSFREKSKKASNSAKIRWDNDANAMRTQCNEDANHKPLTIKKKGTSPHAPLWISLKNQQQKRYLTTAKKYSHRSALKVLLTSTIVTAGRLA